MNTNKLLPIFILTLVACLGLMAYLIYEIQGLNKKLERTPILSELPLEKSGSAKMIDPYHLDPLSNDWDPFAGIEAMRKRMDQIMNDMSAGQLSLGSDRFGFSIGSPSVYLQEDTDQYRVIVEVPENYEIKLDTKLESGVFTIEGELQSKQNQSKQNQSLRLLQSSSFSRSFLLEKPVDEASLRVEKNGEKFIATVDKVT